MKASYVYLFSGLLSAAMLVGCGGSSGGGTPAATAADITAENVDTLSVAAAEATKTAIEAESSGGDTSNIPTGFFKSSTTAPLKDKLDTGIRSATTIPDISTELCPLGGSASMDTNADYTNTTMSFSSCNDGETTITGSVTITGDMLGGGSISITYNNIVVTDNSTGQSETINGTVTCSDGGYTCDYSGVNVGGASLSDSDFSGDDGRDYSFEGDVTVTGDDSGWNVDATVVDPDHGAITISAQNVTFGVCPNGLPDGGTITVTGNGQTATVTFIDCYSFSVQYDGSTIPYNWSDYGL